jgi:hypothetical protein
MIKFYIFLEQTQTINKIGTQGPTNRNDWVTGYFLEYSQDGQRWTEYSESGDNVNSNVSTIVGIHCFDTNVLHPFCDFYTLVIGFNKI